MRGSSSQRKEHHVYDNINRPLDVCIIFRSQRSSDLFSIRFVPIVLSVIYLSAHAFIPSLSMESNAFQNAMPDNGGDDTVARLSQIIKMCF